jgi:hypothetical protein
MNANDVDDSSLDYRNSHYYVIDGQQRLTTIIIFLSALFEKLRQIRKDNGNDELNEQETQCFQDMIRWGSNTYRFSTVEYDNRLFKDYVIDQIKKDEIGFDTESIKRIADAFSFFKRQICERDENYITRMIKIVSNASCSTHIVEGETKAIQMFIFQNNRGKKPSNLEIIKAQFMYNIHLYGGEEKSGLIKEIKNRFENIYQSISLIEYEINEDEVLNYTLKIYFNSLSEGNALDKINKQLSGENQISFIKTFTHALELSFQYLRAFFGDDQRQNFAIHSIITLGGLGIAFPFIIKA